MLLSDCKNVKDIYQFFMQDGKIAYESLQEERFLQPLQRCKKSSCRTLQTLNKNKAYKGGYAAYCKMCKKFSNLTDGTFFEGTHLSFEDVFIVLWFWVCHVSSNDASKVAGISRESIVQYFRYFR